MTVAPSPRSLAEAFVPSRGQEAEYGDQVAGEANAPSRAADDVEVAVIGAGQAGLAMGSFPCREELVRRRWTFRVGDQVKLRLVNEMDSDHPMPHPFHVHGAGRFLILARDDVVEPNLVWKDTVLVRTGETVDILLDVTNPGRWMAHCHIAEHHESGMMFSFNVVPAARD